MCDRAFDAGLSLPRDKVPWQGAGRAVSCRAGGAQQGCRESIADRAALPSRRAPPPAFGLGSGRVGTRTSRRVLPLCSAPATASCSSGPPPHVPPTGADKIAAGRPAVSGQRRALLLQPDRVAAAGAECGPFKRVSKRRCFNFGETTTSSADGLREAVPGRPGRASCYSEGAGAARGSNINRVRWTAPGTRTPAQHAVEHARPRPQTTILCSSADVRGLAATEGEAVRGRFTLPCGRPGRPGSDAERLPPSARHP